jgi:ligand-binding sensor protein
VARITEGNVVCPQCHNYGGDPEKGTCPRCLHKCEAGLHLYSINYYDSCPYCEAAIKKVHES